MVETKQSLQLVIFKPIFKYHLHHLNIQTESIPHVAQ